MSTMALSLLAAAALAADPSQLAPRETAHTLPAGTWRVGVFNPLQIGLGGGFELQTHPLLFFVSPNVVLRKQQLQAAGWTVTGEAGVSVPTLALRLVRGYLFPTHEEIGWLLVPRLGLLASHGDRNALTLSADVAFGLALTDHQAGPRGTHAPLEMLLAPALGGYRVRAGGAYDLALADWLRARAYADGYVHGATEGVGFTVRAGAGLELAVGAAGRFTLGAIWWNSDQGAHDALGNFHRSNDLYPTADFLWTW